MAVEIERKFLVSSDGWQAHVVKRISLRDGLVLAADGRKLRVRIRDDRASLTFKGRRTGLAREEFDYEIPVADAQRLIAQHCDGMVTEKVRHVVLVGDLTWEIDVYTGLLAGITIVEVELPRENHPFPLPDWIGAEITGQEAYRKINMVRARLGRG